jgi:hypothetical protein
MIVQGILMAVLITVAFMPVVSAQQVTEEQREVIASKITAAVEAAEKWLAVVDSGKYNDSWAKAAQYFKDKIPEGQWETSLRQVREPLGSLVSREVANYQFLTYVPGAPKGEFVVIQFKTSFEEKPGSMETITPMLESDGQWRISGYYIK